MRTAALSALVVALGCGALAGAIVTSASPGADAAAPPTVVHYRDPAQLDRPQLDVTGTLLTVDYDTTRHADAHAVRLSGGRLIPAALQTSQERPSAFDGSLAISPALAAELARHGVQVSNGQHLDSSTAQGRTAISVAEAESVPLPVSLATLTTQGRPTTAPSTPTTATPSTPGTGERSSRMRPAAAGNNNSGTRARLYAAVITNRGSIEQSHSKINGYLDAMRRYWQSEAGSAISSFTQPSATVYYSSSAAASTSEGCGMADPTTIWNEAAAKFRGVDFDADGNHLAVLVADDCAGPAGAGVGTIGDDLTSAGDTVVSLSDAAVAIGAHELGHNVGLGHSNAQRCSGSSCSTVADHALYSVMGVAVAGGGWTPTALDTARRVQLGLADSAEAPTVTNPATVHIADRGASSGTRGFVLTDPTTDVQYAVDYRSGTDRDSSAFYRGNVTLKPFNYRPGVVVERIESDDSTTLITRASGSTYLTALTPGQALTVGAVTVKVLRASPSDGADVQVTMTAAARRAASKAPRK